jgi:hypothetical protein
MAMLLLLGAQFMSIGFLAELFTAYYGRTSVPYSIKARTDQTDTRAANEATGSGAANEVEPADWR